MREVTQTWHALRNIALFDVGVAAGVAATLLGIGLLLRGAVRARAAKLRATPEHELMELPFEVASRTTSLFLVVVAVAAGLATLDVSQRMHRLSLAVLTTTLALQVGIWGSAAMMAWLERKRQVTLVADRAAAGSLALIGFVARAAIWSVVALLVLDNLGVNITALVAGLGVGGIAVALAVQNVLGDLLASLSIALDRPFLIGDFVVVDDFMGSVENVGIKSVRLRSLSGEQIIMSNTDLLGSRVRNYGRMSERRVPFTLGVTYDTPRSKLEKIPGLLRAVIEAAPDTRFDRSHFAKYGSFALEFETVYYVLSADYNRYMETQQKINFAIHEAFEREEIQFAFPTQTLWLNRNEPRSA